MPKIVSYSVLPFQLNMVCFELFQCRYYQKKERGVTLHISNVIMASVGLNLYRFFIFGTRVSVIRP